MPQSPHFRNNGANTWNKFIYSEQATLTKIHCCQTDKCQIYQQNEK